MRQVVKAHTMGRRPIGGVVPGVITAGCAYTLSEFMARTGLARAGLRTARQKGLVVRYQGGRGFVLGSDWLAFLQKAPIDHSGGSDNFTRDR